jgi:hypothetical protein
MKKRAGLVGLTILLVATVAVLFSADRASAVVNVYSASLAGTNEVPPLANGYTGTAEVTVDTVSFQVCVDATTNVPGSDPIILDHIHSGAAGVNGPIVVDFMNNLNTCVTSNATTVGNIVANPSAFYFNVHSTNHPGGALRGQLQLVSASNILIDCDQIAGTAAIKPPLSNVAIDATAISTKGPLAAGTDPFKPVVTTRDCTGILATPGDGGTPDDVGPLTKVAGKLVGSATCDLLADPPITNPLDPLDGKLTLTYTTLTTLLKPWTSSTYIRVAGGNDPDLPDELVVSSGIVTKGAGVGADVFGSFIFAPYDSKTKADFDSNPATPPTVRPNQSFIDGTSTIVAGVGSAEIGLGCIFAQNTIATVFFGTDGTGLQNGVLDSSIGISLPA